MWQIREINPSIVEHVYERVIETFDVSANEKVMKEIIRVQKLTRSLFTDPRRWTKGTNQNIHVDSGLICYCLNGGMLAVIGPTPTSCISFDTYRRREAEAYAANRIETIYDYKTRDAWLDDVDHITNTFTSIATESLVYREGHLPPSSFVQFNDSEFTDHATLLQFLDQSIKLAEAVLEICQSTVVTE